MLKNLHTTITEIEIDRQENNPGQESFYQKGLRTFNKASNNFELNSTVGTSMGAFCLIEGDRFKFSQRSSQKFHTRVYNTSRNNL